MRLIDADKLTVDMEAEAFGGDGAYKIFGYSKHQVDSAPTIDLPLTLNALQEMDGEPVWATQMNAAKGLWMFVDAKQRLCRDVYGCRLAFGDFGKTWLAYRRKPEV